MYPIWLCSHRGRVNHPSISDHKSFSRSRRLFSMWCTQTGDTWKWCGQVRLSGSESSESSGVSGSPGYSLYPDDTGSPVQNLSGWFRYFWSSSVATGPPVLMNSWASFCHPWELDAASGLELRFHLTPGFPEDPICRLEALSIPGLFDAIGLFTDEELVETVDVRFIAVGFDFATILLSSFCSCILFAIVSVQQVKLKFWAQQRELKWMMLNRWRRFLHSSRVKVPFVNKSEIWCLVSMDLIWIQGSKLILSNNQSRATLWVFDTCLIVRLLSSIVILITASYNKALDFFTNVQHRSGLRKFFTFEGTWRYKSPCANRSLVLLGIMEHFNH